MKWQTKEEVQKAAKGTLLDALKCSREHHQQGAECPYEEAATAVGREYLLDEDSCALCVYAGFTCGDCPLESCDSPATEFRRLAVAKSKFTDDRSRANFEAFQAAERKMVAKLDELIAEEKAKTEKPKFVWEFGKVCYQEDYPEDIRICLYGKTGLKIWVDVNGHRCNSEPAEVNYIDTGFSVFDDLEALKEDVTEFEMDCEVLSAHTIKALIFGDRVDISTSGCDVRLSGKNLRSLISNLTKIEATLKRRQK